MSIGFIGALLAFFLRLLLGGMFLSAGVSKLKDRHAFEGALRSLVGAGWAQTFLSRGLPFLEAVLGVLLLFNVAPVFVIGCMLLLLVLFSIALLYGWRTHKLEECGCMRTPLSPKAALLRNGLLLVSSAVWLWHPDPSFSSWFLLVEGAVALFMMLGAIQGGRSISQGHPRLSAGSEPSRRSLLRRGLALGAAIPLSFLSPVASLAFACSCSCPGQGYYVWGECICGISELYYAEVTLCCYINTVCDEWLLAVGFADC